MMNAFKREQEDQQILDRRGPNGGEALIDFGPKELASGWQLVDLLLREKHVLRINCSDLRHYYHTWVVSLQRALTNAVGPPIS